MKCEAPANDFQHHDFVGFDSNDGDGDTFWEDVTGADGFEEERESTTPLLVKRERDQDPVFVPIKMAYSKQTTLVQKGNSVKSKYRLVKQLNIFTPPRCT